MKQAFVNESQARAVCCWDAPDKTTIEGLFSLSGLEPTSVEEVVEY